MYLGPVKIFKFMETGGTGERTAIGENENSMNVLLSWAVAGRIIGSVFSVMWLGCFVVVSC